MKYAQRCKACKEIFVLQERVESCPSCAAPMPKPRAKQAVQATPELAWDEWRKLEPKKPDIKTDRQWQCVKTGRVSCKHLNNVAGPSVTEGAMSDVASSDVITEFLDINEEIAGLYSLLYGFMSKNTELIKESKLGGSKNMSYGELCDFGFFCREAENTLDELRKEVKARKELCGQVIAMRKTQESLSDPNIKLKVTGQYATGSPDVKMQAQLPKKFTPEYYQITDFFKVPREVASTGVLRIDWKASGEFITQLAADGHKPPDGFGKQYPTYVTTFRRRRRAK